MAEGWIDLNQLDAWRNYKADTLSAQWRVEDGIFTLADTGGGDIVSRAQYENFELEIDWKIAPGGNSGVMFHVVEADSIETVWHSGPEMQIIDDTGYKSELDDRQLSGANYDMHAVPSPVARAVGEWNESRLIVDQGHVEHWLNGQKAVEYDLGSADWEERLANSKFIQYPLYGRAGKGHLALQDHGSQVWFRKIRVRELGGE